MNFHYSADYQTLVTCRFIMTQKHSVLAEPILRSCLVYQIEKNPEHFRKSLSIWTDNQFKTQFCQFEQLINGRRSLPSYGEALNLREGLKTQKKLLRNLWMPPKPI